MPIKIKILVSPELEQNTYVAKLKCRIAPLPKKKSIYQAPTPLAFCGKQVDP